MTRSGFALVCTLTLAVTVSAAGFAATTSHRIGPSSIAGARVGLGEAAYVGVLGQPNYTTQYAGGLTRLSFRNGKVQVYLASPRGKGLAVLTAGDDYKTDQGIGPCSTLTALKRAYGRKLVPIRLGRGRPVVAYRLGSLLFATPSLRIALVALATSRFPVSIAVNAPACGAGEEG
jgi:hypothetical protein